MFVAERERNLWAGRVVVSSTDYEPFCIAAAAFLYGRALIIGAGKCVAARVAAMNPCVVSVLLLDNRPELLAWAALEHLIPDNIQVVVVDAADFSDEGGFDSVFYDAFPVDSKALDGAARVARYLKPGGRLIFWSGAYSLSAFGPEFEEPRMVYAGKPAETPRPLIVTSRRRNP